MKNSKLAQWSSRWFFIMAATGSAVGLGNVWKFPYITGQNGGGAFVLMYLGLVALVGLPILMAEIMLGRRGAASPVKALERVALESGLPKAWAWLGGAGIITAFFLLAIYSVIAGWAMAYVINGFSGVFNGMDAGQISRYFDNFLKDPKQLLLWHSVFMGVTALIVSRGLQNGLERAIQILVPGLFIILLLLLGYSAMTPGFMQGVTFMFKPDFSQVTGAGFLLALGQAFFTLSIATASMLIYGAYLTKEASIFKAAASIAVLDTLAAILAGLAIFPIVFTYNLAPTEGPGLVFKTLPIAFGEMPYGQVFSGLFFMLLVFAALGSSISMVEPIVAWVTERWKIVRLHATWLVSGLIWLVGVGAVFSFNIWENYRLFGVWNYYELLDNLVFMILLPLGGLLLALFSGWFMKREYSFAELNIPHWMYHVWRFSVRYLGPVAVLVMAWMMFN
jgi:neurotransmitter:Na+ symporter, NSS family